MQQEPWKDAAALSCKEPSAAAAGREALERVEGKLCQGSCPGCEHTDSKPLPQSSVSTWAKGG